MTDRFSLKGQIAVVTGASGQGLLAPRWESRGAGQAGFFWGGRCAWWA